MYVTAEKSNMIVLVVSSLLKSIALSSIFFKTQAYLKTFSAIAKLSGPVNATICLSDWWKCFELRKIFSSDISSVFFKPTVELNSINIRPVFGIQSVGIGCTYIRYKTETIRAPTEIPKPGSIPQIIVPRQHTIQTAASILKDFKKKIVRLKRTTLNISKLVAVPKTVETFHGDWQLQCQPEQLLESLQNVFPQQLLNVF